MEKLVSSPVKHWVQMSKTHSKGKSLQQIIVLSFLYKSTRASWNKTFKQVLSFFFQLWHQLYLYFGQHFTLIWNLKKQFLNLWKCCFKLFRILQIEYIKKHKQAFQTVWKYPLFLQYFWLQLNMVHLHRVSTKNELFNWGLSHVIRS